MLGCSGLEVADDSVMPEVGDFDFDGVVSFFQPEIGTKRQGCGPHGSGIMTVYLDASYLVDLGKPKQHLFAISKGGRRGFCLVDCGSGEEANAVVGRVGPALGVGNEDGLGWRASTGLEGDGPFSLYHKGLCLYDFELLL